MYSGIKKSLLSIFFILILLITGYSQPCLPDGIIFTTQTQIDNFPINYPNCTEIGGFVRIVGEDILNLNGLSNIISIGQELSLEECSSLTSIAELSNLISIGGGLSVTSCTQLVSLHGLENITHLSALCFSYNNSLPNFQGLNNLDSIQGAFYLQNTGLIDFSGLNRLKTIGGVFDIYWSSNLVSFSGLDSLENIGSYFSIDNTFNLTDISSLSSLHSIGGGISITETGLSSLEGLENIETSTISNLSIYRNGNLSNCEVESICDYLTSPNGKVAIYNNAEGCNSPPAIAHSCGNIMPCLPYGNYYIDKQSIIDNFQTDYPDCTSLNGDVLIFNYDIDSLVGLIPIKSIAGDLAIFKTDNLVSLEGLDSLNTVIGSLYIGGYEFWPYYYIENVDLVDVSSLSNLTYIGYELIIADNLVLESLTGLDNVAPSVMESIEIIGNEMLSKCAIKSICNYISANKYIDIAYNDDGCNSKEEVEEACLVSTPDNNSYPDYVLYPNPTNKILNIQVENDLSKVVIYNHIGEEVKSFMDVKNNINVSGIGKGFFIIELYINHSIIRDKIIVE